MTERVDQRPPQGHGLESPGHMGQTWKVLNARIGGFGSCRDLSCLPLFWSLEEEVRGSHGASVFTIPLHVDASAVRPRGPGSVCSSPPGAGRGGAGHSVWGPDPGRVSLLGGSPQVLSPQRASSSSKRTPALLHPAPYPPSIFLSSCFTILHFYSRRKEGCFPVHQHMLP